MLSLIVGIFFKVQGVMVIGYHFLLSIVTSIQCSIFMI